MNWKETYTKVFLKHLDIGISDASMAEYMPLWWQNIRSADGGFRLTESGYEMMTEKLNITMYDVPFPPDFDMTTQTVIFLDKFIDCPYYLLKNGITVSCEKKALELHLFSGDVRKYGLSKALKRQK